MSILTTNKVIPCMPVAMGDPSELYTGFLFTQKNSTTKKRDLKAPFFYNLFRSSTEIQRYSIIQFTTHLEMSFHPWFGNGTLYHSLIINICLHQGYGHSKPNFFNFDTNSLALIGVTLGIFYFFIHTKILYQIYFSFFYIFNHQCFN